MDTKKIDATTIEVTKPVNINLDEVKSAIDERMSQIADLTQTRDDFTEQLTTRITNHTAELNGKIDALTEQNKTDQATIDLGATVGVFPTEEAVAVDAQPVDIKP